MSLYQMQKFLFDINRDPALQKRFLGERTGVLSVYDLTAEERAAIAAGDIGLLYVLGANGQLLMHYAAGSGASRDTGVTFAAFCASRPCSFRVPLPIPPCATSHDGHGQTRTVPNALVIGLTTKVTF